MFNENFANSFALEWEAGWNSHNIETILSHYRDDIVFRSKKAIAIVGHGEISGKNELKRYWSAALERQPDLKFTVQDVFTGYEMMVISYLNHRAVLAAECLYFDSKAMVYQAAACHASKNS